MNPKTEWYKAVGPIMKELFTDELLKLHSFRGIKRKGISNIRFDQYTNVLGAIYEMYVYARDTLKRLKDDKVPSKGEVEEKISEIVRHAKERIEKRASKTKIQILFFVLFYFSLIFQLYYYH